jgi:hypothetical protein
MELCTMSLNRAHYNYKPSRYKSEARSIWAFTSIAVTPYTDIFGYKTEIYSKTVS